MWGFFDVVKFIKIFIYDRVDGSIVRIEMCFVLVEVDGICIYIYCWNKVQIDVSLINVV